MLMQYSFDSSVETTLWVFSHSLICNSQLGYFHHRHPGKQGGDRLEATERKTELKFHLIACMIFFLLKSTFQVVL